MDSSTPFLEPGRRISRGALESVPCPGIAAEQSTSEALFDSTWETSGREGQICPGVLPLRLRNAQAPGDTSCLF